MMNKESIKIIEKEGQARLHATARTIRVLERELTTIAKDISLEDYSPTILTTFNQKVDELNHLVSALEFAQKLTGKFEPFDSK